MKDKFKSTATIVNNVGNTLEYWYDKIQTDGGSIIEHTIISLKDGSVLIVIHYTGDDNE